MVRAVNDPLPAAAYLATIVRQSMTSSPVAATRKYRCGRVMPACIERTQLVEELGLHSIVAREKYTGCMPRC